MSQDNGKQWLICCDKHIVQHHKYNINTLHSLVACICLTNCQEIMEYWTKCQEKMV